MVKTYQVKCTCGEVIKVEVDDNCQQLRLTCCNKILLDLGARQATPPNDATSDRLVVQSPPLNKTTSMPDVNRKKKQFGHYDIIKPLGRGAMGDVYLALDTKKNEEVALKILKNRSKEKSVDYFVREAQVLIDLNHRNIVGIRGWGNVRDIPYVAMEYLKGSTLEEYLDQGVLLPVRHGVQVICYVLDAMIHAHSSGVIHRDIKPSNIFITHEKAIKVIDFGIGKSKEGVNLTNTGEIMGTPHYMPPEQIKNAKGADYLADIYAIGATLFHILAGQAPYSEHKQLTRILMAKSKNSNYERLGELRPELPPAMVHIVEKSMAFEPKNRYQSAQIMKDAILPFRTWKN